jgi:hypothetical protein
MSKPELTIVESGAVQSGRKRLGPDSATKRRWGFRRGRTHGEVQMFGTDRGRGRGSGGAVQLQPQRITELRGKPRSCQA